jgi:hypothetical protein
VNEPVLVRCPYRPLEMGDARTGRPFCSRYALCSCKSISTEISARNNTAVQKNIVAPRATLIQRLTHSMRKSRSPSSLSVAVTLSTAFAFDSRRRPAFAKASAWRARLPLQSYLHRDRCFDRWMWIVADELEVFEFEVVNVFDRRI